MLFNSLEFLVFFPVVVALYFLVPLRVRWAVLLAGSYYFYMSWRAEYGLLLLLSTLIDYFAALRMPGAATRARRKFYLIVSICSNLGLLFTFKYFNLFSDSLGRVLGSLEVGYTPPLHDLLLPVGISFYTFQTLSYSIDVFMDRRPPERHFGRFALYVSFFPQLVAGPIERSQNLLPQFLVKHDVDYERFTSGIRLIAWGFFKKLVIADRVAPIVHTVYSDPTSFSGIPLIVATHLFAIQVYCDFSGYSDIAIGTARVMGYDLRTNFRQPYFSRSIAEFWQRWHISLSTWFRDYVYLPLGGNRVSRARWYFNISMVFLLSGFWHGANWTYLIWGGLHGMYVVVGAATVTLRARVVTFLRLDRAPLLHDAIKLFITFELFVLALAVFRSPSLPDAVYVVRSFFLGLEFRTGYGLNIGGPYDAGLLALSIFTLFFVDWLEVRGAPVQWFRQQPLPVRWAVYYVVLFSILLFGEFGSREFIYFQF